MDSEGEDFYDDDDSEILDDDSAEEKKEVLKPPAYKVVKEEEIRQLQQTLISEVCSVLSVPRGAALTLLSQNNWTLTSDVYEEWFSKGSSEEQQQQKQTVDMVCNICYETKQKQDMLSASSLCAHLFCVECWTSYISVSIQDGRLTLPCPEPGCNSESGPDMVDSLASPSDKDRYYHFLYQSYIESNPDKIKYCPSPGCVYAITLLDGMGSGSFEVICDCGHKLCWNCREESHCPLDCSTVSKWIEKNSSEAENTKYILAYTKPCPKCHKAIEKNQGCNHMTCRPPCNHHFCWVCLGSFDNHHCNEYKAEANSNEQETSREYARKHLAKYTHYYERWDSNDKARKRALEDLTTARDKHVRKLSVAQRIKNETELEWVVDAWDQIVDCRRVLKWTYAYGYYLSETESGSSKLDFFGHLQGEAENALERLHHMTEKEMLKYINARGPLEGFIDFRSKLVGLTVITKNYFGNLVRALENNLSEVWI